MLFNVWSLLHLSLYCLYISTVELYNFKARGQPFKLLKLLSAEFCVEYWSSSPLNIQQATLTSSSIMFILWRAAKLIRPMLTIFSLFTWSRSSAAIFTGCPAKLFPLGYLLFCRLLLVQIAKVGSFMKNSGNLLQDRHKHLENWLRNNWDNCGQSWHALFRN